MDYMKLYVNDKKDIQLGIFDNHGKNVILNIDLISEQRLSLVSVARIMNIHRFRSFLINKMMNIKLNQDESKFEFRKKLLRYMAKTVEKCDYTLQYLWGFTQDSSYHAFWDLPHCKCPKYDNIDRIGIQNEQIYDYACPIHGKN